MACNANFKSPLEQTLTGSLLEAVGHFWFEHMVDDEHFVVPDKEDAGPWFSQTDAFDAACS